METKSIYNETKFNYILKNKNRNIYVVSSVIIRFDFNTDPYLAVYLNTNPDPYPS